MSVAEHIAVVIPVYNQPTRLREVVCRCLKVHPWVLVVDDGSDPEILPSLDDLPVEVLRHEVNRGKGTAVMTATHHLQQKGATHIIVLDADGQHYPEDVPRVIDAVRRHPEAIVIGVRDFTSVKGAWPSRFGRTFSNFWAWVQTGTRVHDIQSGFRAYPLFALEHLPCRSKGYGFEVEVVVRALWSGLGVRTVDVRVHYPQPRYRSSHFHKIRDNLRLTLLNTHLTLRALAPWPHRKVAKTGVEASVSLRHPLRSIGALLSERATPRELAFAVALGIFLGALPLIGCHTLIILVAAALLRLNRVAAVVASQLCMPPVVPALCIEMGFFIRYGRFLTLSGLQDLENASFLDVGYMGLQRLLEWFLGALVVGTALALVLGLITFSVAWTLKRSRRAS
jgi:uncharacterized protein (DUF2062 family)